MLGRGRGRASGRRRGRARPATRSAWSRTPGGDEHVGEAPRRSLRAGGTSVRTTTWVPSASLERRWSRPVFPATGPRDLHQRREIDPELHLPARGHAPSIRKELGDARVGVSAARGKRRARARSCETTTSPWPKKPGRMRWSALGTSRLEGERGARRDRRRADAAHLPGERCTARAALRRPAAAEPRPGPGALAPARRARGISPERKREADVVRRCVESTVSRRHVAARAATRRARQVPPMAIWATRWSEAARLGRDEIEPALREAGAPCASPARTLARGCAAGGVILDARRVAARRSTSLASPARISLDLQLEPHTDTSRAPRLRIGLRWPLACASDAGNYVPKRNGALTHGSGRPASPRRDPRAGRRAGARPGHGRSARAEPSQRRRAMRASLTGQVSRIGSAADPAPRARSPSRRWSQRGPPHPPRLLRPRRGRRLARRARARRAARPRSPPTRASPSSS